MIDRAAIDRALRICKRWKDAAKRKGKKDAESDAQHLEKVIHELTGIKPGPTGGAT